MLTILRRSAVAGIVVFVALQLVPNPIKANTVESRQQVATASSSHDQFHINGEVAGILERSCSNCHSNRTKWPWYSHIAPISWMLNKHVAEGRKKLNFSNWQTHPPTQNELSELCDAVDNKSMPLPGYTVLHPEAKLSKPDVKAVCDWTDSGPFASLHKPQSR